MNPSTLQGAAALVLGTVVIVWVYLLKTNNIRWYRWPLAVIAVAAGYTLVTINSKIVSHTRISADAVTWWENASLAIVTLLVVALPALHVWNGHHVKRCSNGRALKGSHAHVRARG